MKYEHFIAFSSISVLARRKASHRSFFEKNCLFYAKTICLTILWLFSLGLISGEAACLSINCELSMPLQAVNDFGVVCTFRIAEGVYLDVLQSHHDFRLKVLSHCITVNLQKKESPGFSCSTMRLHTQREPRLNIISCTVGIFGPRLTEWPPASPIINLVWSSGYHQTEGLSRK